jgi:hypothetical protein
VRWLEGMNVKKKKVIVPNNFVGWIDKKHRIGWVVSPWRKDQRSGVVRRAKR